MIDTSLETLYQILSITYLHKINLWIYIGSAFDDVPRRKRTRPSRDSRVLWGEEKKKPQTSGSIPGAATSVFFCEGGRRVGGGGGGGGGRRGGKRRSKRAEDAEGLEAGRGGGRVRARVEGEEMRGIGGRERRAK